jgi:hypothetical protein
MRWCRCGALSVLHLAVVVVVVVVAATESHRSLSALLLALAAR